MNEEKNEEIAFPLDSPETITKRIEQHIVRGALDEELRARKALNLLRARDRKIAYLEKKLADFQNRSGGDCSPRVGRCADFLGGDSSFESSGRETTYLSMPPTEAPDSLRRRNEVKRSEKTAETLSIPRLKLPATTSTSNSGGDSAVILKAVGSDFASSSFASDEFPHGDESSVDLVAKAARPFSKLEENIDQKRGCFSRVLGDERVANEPEDKKLRTGGSSRNFIFARKSTSLPWMKTRRRGSGKIGKTRGMIALRRNLEEVQAGLDALLPKKSRGCGEPLTSVPDKQKVEDKVVQEDAQEAASTPHNIPVLERRTASTQTCTDFSGGLLYPSTRITSTNIAADSSNNDFVVQRVGAQVLSTSDEPAPQWLIEEALNRGRKFSKNNQSVETIDSQEEVNKDIDAGKLNHEYIIFDLEKQLCAARVELAEALTEQSAIKNRYKKALKNAKVAADEERDELQRKLVHICTSVLEKFGPDALNNNRFKPFHKRHRKAVHHFGKLSRKLHRKLKMANLLSTKLKREVSSARKDLDEKTRQYDSLVKCFADLKIEFKNTESNLNDLSNENASLRKRIDDARAWMQTRVGKERNEKINAAQFRDIQRSRELANLRKKSEEDFSTIAQLRGKLLRSEAANSNKGFLLNSYKIQLADLSKEKDKLLSQIKDLESENGSLRNSNAQLKAHLTLINNEKDKLATESEKSEMDMKERMQTKLATKYERSMLQKIDTMKEKYDKVVEGIDNKLKYAENLARQYFEAIKRFLKGIHEYYQELDAERDLSCSDASEREAHETACTILNITPGELTGFLRGRPSNKINSWLSDVQKITANPSFAEDLGNFLFARAIGSAKN